MQVKKKIATNVDAHGFEYEKTIAPDAPILKPKDKPIK